MEDITKNDNLKIIELAKILHLHLGESSKYPGSGNNMIGSRGERQQGMEVKKKLVNQN